MGELNLADSSHEYPEVGVAEVGLFSRTAGLPLRERQVLQALQFGKSEKEVAIQLGLSQHTIHVYTKSLYKKFGVCSRPELLSLWIVGIRNDNPARTKGAKSAVALACGC